MNKKLLIKSIEEFVTQKEDYYKQWIYDEPIVVSNSHHQKLEKLHKVMYKLITHFVNNFNNFGHLMMLSDKTKLIVKNLENIKYKVGTFRTDFVYDDKKQPKLIEITCRFALNSLFVSSVFDSLSTKYQQKLSENIETINLFKNLYPYLADLSGKGDVFILKGKDKKNASIIFKEIFEKTGVNVIEVNVTNIRKYIDKMDVNSFIVTELTLDEIESLDIDLICNLSKLNIINDFRTVLLIHNKQFFSVLGNEDLQKGCLTNDEIDFFSDFYIPTYNKNESIESWEDAKVNKDCWILKHKALGKSKSIYAGIVTSQEEWNKLFNEENLEDFVLQSWVPQSRIKGRILDKEFEDYITGTLLFFNEHYFGLGPFRTSSHPVTNVVDDRKFSSLVLKDDFDTTKNVFLNYIDS